MNHCRLSYVMYPHCGTPVNHPQGQNGQGYGSKKKCQFRNQHVLKPLESHKGIGFDIYLLAR
jgi:hypothetical protein